VAAAPRWIHALAVLTVLAVLPLMFLGAEVTTKGVGMVDPQGFRWPWEVVGLLADSQNWTNSALLTELTHRLFGFLVGIFSILLCLAMLAFQPGAKRWLGLLVLILVIAQGLLGRYRVDLNALVGPSLAWVHGSFAPIVFATLAGVAFVTARDKSAVKLVAAAPALRRWSLTMVVVVYLQLVVGGMVRHQPTLLAARGHLLGAFVAAAGLLWLVKLAWDKVECRWPSGLILGLLSLQVLLGVEAWFSWMKRYFVPLSAHDETTMMHWLRSGHYVIGALLFALTVIVAIQAHRDSRTGEAAA
jgi:heme A synthase